MKKSDFLKSILESIKEKSTIFVVCNNPNEILDFLKENNVNAIANNTKTMKNKFTYDELGIIDFYSYEQVSKKSYIFNLK